MFVTFKFTAVILRSNLVTVNAVNIEARVPIVRVIANPLIGPVPNWNNIAVIIKVVKFPSKNKNCRVCGEHADIKSVKENRMEYVGVACPVK